jgi:RsiW-degrading membrane proteinase PrsW (M82 family)
VRSYLEDDMKNKLKNAFLIFSIYILTAAILGNFLHKDAFDDGKFWGLVLSIFITPLIIYVWNRLVPKK